MYTATEARTRQTFLALMNSLSFPGRLHRLPEDNPFVLIGETLLDLETSYHTPDAALAQSLAVSGARGLPPERAAYHFYPNFMDDHLPDVRAASIGTMRYPDQAATLIIGCTLGAGDSFRLSGPGIQSTTTLTVTGLPAAFWQIRTEAIRYPLGWDVFLVDGQRVVGLPRTTIMEA